MTTVQDVIDKAPSIGEAIKSLGFFYKDQEDTAKDAKIFLLGNTLCFLMTRNEALLLPPKIDIETLKTCLQYVLEDLLQCEIVIIEPTELATGYKQAILSQPPVSVDALHLATNKLRDKSFQFAALPKATEYEVIAKKAMLDVAKIGAEFYAKKRHQDRLTQKRSFPKASIFGALKDESIKSLTVEPFGDRSIKHKKT